MLVFCSLWIKAILKTTAILLCVHKKVRLLAHSENSVSIIWYELCFKVLKFEKGHLRLTTKEEYLYVLIFVACICQLELCDYQAALCL